MTRRFDSHAISRRAILRGGLLAVGGAVLGPVERARAAWLERAVAQQPAAAPDALAAMRSAMASAAVERAPLTDALSMLSGPGGNVVVLNGRDGKVVVDTFVRGSWEGLKTALQAIGPAPPTAAINTHWHYDHSDNNPHFRGAGAAVIAHANTPRRMSQAHELKPLGLKIPPSPPEDLPTKTFRDTHTLDVNREQVRLGYVPPAHTDTDIYVRFSKGNVLHLGDLYFNGMYPFIDGSTGGNINGMVAAADMCLKLADASTRIVPGHGPLGNASALRAYRDMLASVRDRVQKLKQAGRTIDEAVAAKPTADLDETWGKGFLSPDLFVRIVYETL